MYFFQKQKAEGCHTQLKMLLWIYCVHTDVNDTFIADRAGCLVGFCLGFFCVCKQVSVLDGNMQQYVYRQEPATQCRRRTHVTIRYPVFVPTLVIRRRFQRAARMPAPFQRVRVNPYPSGNAKFIQFLSHNHFHRGCS